ncbi:unnamed protein product [Symbiodinium pilosum]|uniref:Uncharacterized protein n=1 Tax=Symbiodinium pilosum TaxID=2952 RepID=A0A812VNU5_SYMPI|nr:unnamed protein product [Symbiodinium pilosum]
MMADSLAEKPAANFPTKRRRDRLFSSPFSSEPLQVEEIHRSAQSLGASVQAGDDDTATGAGVAGIMSGALGSLQESGFAARRATSRLLHMQTPQYLHAHHRCRLASPERAAIE